MATSSTGGVITIHWAGGKIECTDGWYEWNSCTSLYSRGDCSWFNWNGCTEQYTVTGTNGYGGGLVNYSTTCPRDLNGDGVYESGGCLPRNGTTFTVSGNFMTLYELDKCDEDEFVETLYFLDRGVVLSCDAFGCGPVQSPWTGPYGYLNVRALISLNVYESYFYDPYNQCQLDRCDPNTGICR